MWEHLRFELDFGLVIRTCGWLFWRHSPAFLCFSPSWPSSAGSQRGTRAGAESGLGTVIEQIPKCLCSSTKFLFSFSRVPVGCWCPDVVSLSPSCPKPGPVRTSSRGSFGNQALSRARKDSDKSRLQPKISRLVDWARFSLFFRANSPPKHTKPTRCFPSRRPVSSL